MGSLGFYFDMDRCIGCKTCQIACKEQNKLPNGVFFRKAGTQQMDTPTGRLEFNYSGACNHCDAPACINACPTGAMQFAPDGTVVHDDSRCIGCGRCVHSCPYGAVSINEVTGYAQKCDACAALRAEGNPPACVLACPTRALRFGNTEELEREYGSGVRASVCFLPDAAETRPSTVIANAPKAMLINAAKPEIIDRAAEETFAPNDTDETIVVLGSGPAAVMAVQSFRKYNRTAKVVMFTQEKEKPYCRPLLSKALLHGFTASLYRMVDEQWLRDNRVELHLGDPIIRLDAENHCIMPQDGTKVFFDKCIYALGADCFVPPMQGAGKAGVLTVRKMQDLEQVRRARLNAKNAVVIGGGFIGLETAWQLQKAGLHITIVEITPTLMGRLVDAKTAQVLKEEIQAAGIDVMTGIGIEAIYGNERAEGIRLIDGREISAEIVIVSTGVHANVTLAKAAGLETGRAVMVNERMETSEPDIYACGDCCEYQGMNSATWVESIRQGHIAGANAAGKELTFQNEPNSIVVHTAGTALYAIGDMGKNTNGTYTLISGILPACEHRFRVNGEYPARTTNFTACFLHGKLEGMTLVGDLGWLQLARGGIGTPQERFLQNLKEKGAQIDAESDAKRVVS